MVQNGDNQKNNLEKEISLTPTSLAISVEISSNGPQLQQWVWLPIVKGHCTYGGKLTSKAGERRISETSTMLLMEEILNQFIGILSD